MKKQRKVIILFSRFCLENNLEYKVDFFSSGFICLENKIFILQVDKTGLATVYIRKTGEILRCKTQIQVVFEKIFQQLV